MVEVPAHGRGQLGVEHGGQDDDDGHSVDDGGHQGLRMLCLGLTVCAVFLV